METNLIFNRHQIWEGGEHGCQAKYVSFFYSIKKLYLRIRW